MKLFDTKYGQLLVIKGIDEEVYRVRDWLTGHVWSFDNIEDAMDEYESILEECKGHECDVELYKLIKEHVSDNLK